MKPLTDIGLKHGTDKAFFHMFTEFYNDYFESYLNRQINILEIGINDGASLKMLKEFFPESIIYAIDINEEAVKLCLDKDIKLFLCNQVDFERLSHLFKDIKFDIIIDDGSHMTSDQQLSLAFLFPFLKKEGLYVCEDIHTSNIKTFCNTETSTLEMLETFIKNSKIRSDILRQPEYLNNHIRECKIYQRTGNAFLCYKCKTPNTCMRDLCKVCQTILSPEDKSITSILKKQNLIIDCFIFYNELDMLYYRLKTLYDTVDKFVLVEATHTFVGNKKTLFYQANKERYAEFSDKIIHVIVEDFNENPDFLKNEQWNNEFKQRNAINEGVIQLDLDDEDLIIICDVDEIPNPIVLKDLKKNMASDIVSLKMDFYYYNIECKNTTTNCIASKVCNYKFYKKLEGNCQNIRMCSEHSFTQINDGGWHLSYFGGPDFIENKIKNFCHQEHNTVSVLASIQENVSKYKDLFNRTTDVFSYNPRICNAKLPPDMDLLDNLFKS